MIKKNISLLLILTIFLFTLTGCYDSTGIEEYYYIVALGIDKAENGLINLSIQTAKTNGKSDSGSQQSSNYKIYSVNCRSIDIGINILDNYLNKKINLSHCSAIVFSEEIAKENIKDYVLELGNNIEIRPSCNLIISSKSALDLLNNVSNSGEKFSARLYEYILNSVDYTGYTINATISDFISKIDNNQIQATAIYCKVNEKTVQNSGIVVFKDDKMVGTLSPLETIAYSMIKNELKSCTISIDNPFQENKMINVELQSLKSPTIDVKLVDSLPFITINFDLKGDISSSEGSFNYVNNDDLKKVEEKVNQYMENLIKLYLYNITREFNSDISNFNGVLSTKYLTKDEYDKINWNDVFKESEFEITVNTQITSTHLFNKE